KKFSRDWHITIHHIYREANFTADYLVNLDHDLDLDLHIFNFPYSSLLYWLKFGLVGSCTTRVIANNM
ncbi:hypothetical protein LINPERHAP2_LOCUS37546, partial [Linum perenne]